MNSAHLKTLGKPLLLGLIVIGALMIRVEYVKVFLNEYNIKGFPIK
jgi:hypothetical protein